jgi:Putative Actinobacterial Holin-X, holin superfamily III
MTQPTSVPPTSAHPDNGIGDLVKRVGDDAKRLVRAEVALARAELVGKVRVAGVAVGMIGAAGMIGWFGVAVLIVAGVLGLATVVAAWLAALIVGGALVLIAMIAGLTGGVRLRHVSPLVPTQTIDSVRGDVTAIREAVHR